MPSKPSKPIPIPKMRSMQSMSRYESAQAITPSDTTLISVKALLVGGAGAIVVTPAAGGSNITITAIAGQYIPLAVSKVLATGTVATGIVGLS